MKYKINVSFAREVSKLYLPAPNAEAEAETMKEARELLASILRSEFCSNYIGKYYLAEIKEIKTGKVPYFKGGILK
jgi:hypothetical protein